MRTPVHFLAFGFGTGLAPRAPGTVGTLAGVPIYWLLKDLAPAWYAAGVLVLFIIGVKLCEAAAREFKVKDPSAIVFDEMVGFLVALFLAPPGLGYLLLGFGLFRLFDIVKPYPIKHLERLPGGWGIMCDDVLAGVYAMVVLQAAAWLRS